MVEAGGIEPPSENLLTGPSPGAVCLLYFPHWPADRQANPRGSFFLYDRFKSKQAMHIYHCMTPVREPWSSPGGRAASMGGGAAYAAIATLSLAFNFKFRAF